MCSKPTNGNHEGIVFPPTPPVQGGVARTVLAGKGSLPPRLLARPGPLRAVLASSDLATGDSGGNTIRCEIRPNGRFIRTRILRSNAPDTHFRSLKQPTANSEEAQIVERSSSNAPMIFLCFMDNA